MILNSESKWIPDGFHFLGFEESKHRRALLDKIYIFFREKGFEEVTLPSFDYTSSFQNFLSDSEFQKIFKTKDSNGREISPSIDLTLQVVKGLANYSLEQGSHKVFYIGKTIRDNPSTQTEKREILQLGAEIIGHSNLNTFKMIFSAIDELLKVFEIKEKFTLVLCNTNIIKKIMQELDLNDIEQIYLSKLLYSKDRESLNVFLSEKSIPTNIKNSILELIFSFESKETHEVLRKNFSYLEPFLLEAEELISYSSKLSKLDLCLDYSLVSDLDYYTGFVFHGYYPKFTYPIFMGGAYDNLFHKFSNVEKRASGFAFQLDKIEEVIKYAS